LSGIPRDQDLREIGQQATSDGASRSPRRVALAAARRRSNGPAAAEVTKQRAGRPAEVTMRFINAVICVNAFAPKGKMWRLPASRGSPSSLVRCATGNFPTFPSASTQ
jgi:hypothetical protein